ncbi:Uncharacterised protein [Mycobacteroides abscessus subsp. abscessus]|nr:Uncharacterised protein [Mycobacteroides abscessus subsp. abscessus]
MVRHQWFIPCAENQIIGKISLFLPIVHIQHCHLKKALSILLPVLHIRHFHAEPAIVQV